MSRMVYFLKPKGLDGPIKIGCSDTPTSRLMIFMAWSPFPLELIGSVPGSHTDEQYLHRCFADVHSHGEWFHFSPALREAINKILASSIEEVRSTLTPKGSVRRARTPKPPKTESQKLATRFTNRIRTTGKRLRINNEKGAWHEPDDVCAIMRKWQGNSYKHIEGIHPSDAEMARLEQYLNNPVEHSVIPSWRRRKDSICIPIFVMPEQNAEQLS